MFPKSVSWNFFCCSDRKSKLCKQIRKEVANVRRKLAIQKGTPLTEVEELKQTETGRHQYF